MIDITKIDYSELDRPEILMFLFHPRREWGERPPDGPLEDVLIPVDEGVAVGMRIHMTGKMGPNILFFHGNGEIVADYDDLGQLYNRQGINFLPVDYRGYGRSTGEPTITAMMRDSHVILDYVRGWLAENDHEGPLIVMGRSLGSASALELASHYADQIDGLIIESGFAYIGPLLELLGSIGLKVSGDVEGRDFRNLDKIGSFNKPTLIIHAERDHIIPFSEGQALFDASNAEDKNFLMIPGANHNDIFFLGIKEYMEAITALAARLKH
ncbi:alpha/beta hydrolase [Thermodesulfobacteriota bacterium]